MLLVEQAGDDPLEVGREAAADRRSGWCGRSGWPSMPASRWKKTDRDFYWRLSRRVTTTLYRLKGSTRALPFIEDIAVPPETLPDFLVRLQNVLKARAVTASLFAHIGHGQLHFRPFLDLGNPDHMRAHAGTGRGPLRRGPEGRRDDQRRARGRA